jgi:hypothetical protein
MIPTLVTTFLSLRQEKSSIAYMPNQDTMKTAVHGADIPRILHLSTRGHSIPQFHSDEHEQNHQQQSTALVYYVIPSKV